MAASACTRRCFLPGTHWKSPPVLARSIYWQRFLKSGSLLDWQELHAANCLVRWNQGCPPQNVIDRDQTQMMYCTIYKRRQCAINWTASSPRLSSSPSKHSSNFRKRLIIPDSPVQKFDVAAESKQFVLWNRCVAYWYANCFSSTSNLFLVKFSASGGYCDPCGSYGVTWRRWILVS